MFTFEKVDLINLIIVVGLVIALMISIFIDNNELAMNISAGLLGFLGGLARNGDKI